MRWTPIAWTTGLLALPLLIVAITGGGAMSFSTDLAPGKTHHVQVVDSQGLSVVAGLVQDQAPTLLGFPVGTASPSQTGWIVVHAEGQVFDPSAQASLVDTFEFQDPNGAAWTAYELDTPSGPVWAVQVGGVHEDTTLGSSYNWALIVDWHQVPGDVDLNVTHVSALPSLAR